MSTGIKAYFEAVYGDTTGVAHLATGRGQYVNDAGKYRHQEWIPITFSWPDQADALVKAIEATAQADKRTDTYACPYLMSGSKRSQGAAVARPIIHADIDQGLLDETQVKALRGWAVGSGSPGNGHVYVNLDEPVPANVHRALCSGLGQYLGARDSKISDNDVLRPPGSLNWKGPTYNGTGDPSPVDFLIPPPGYAWPVADLAATLGVDLTALSTQAPTATVAKTAIAETAPVDEVPAAVQKALNQVTPGDRSKDTMRVVAACIDSGLTLPQTRTIVASRTDLAGRLADRRNDDDIQTCWDKVTADRQAAINEVTGEVLTRRSYVHRDDGLLARSLLRDIQRLGPLAAGGDGQVWAYHQEGVWRPDGNRIIVNRAKHLLGEQFRPSYAHTVQVMILSEVPFITDEPVTQYLNVQNGLLDWRTRTLRPHSERVPSTAQLPVRWNPEATCPVIDQFLLEVVDEPEVVALIGEIAGYCCYPDQPLHKAVLLLGEGRNGKGTLLRIIGRLIGESNIAVVPPQDLDGNRFMLAELYGKLANLIGDVEPKTFNETAKFKSATGGDRLTGERKYGHPFGFTNRALIVAAFNTIPKSADTTTGFFSRWIVVPFPHKYVDPAPDGSAPDGARVIDQSLEPRMSTTAEQEGFLVFAVEGLRRLMSSGRFTKAEAVIRAETRFRNAADPVRDFLSQSVVVRVDAWVSRNWLHSQFCRYAEDGKHDKLAARPFLTRVIEVHEELFGFPAIQAKRGGERGWSGIRLRSDDDPEIGDPDQ